MTLKINLSDVKALSFSFDGAVDAHINAMKAHQTTIGEAAPAAHPLVEQAIRRVQYPIEARKPDDFVKDFQVIDDSPSLEERKTALAQAVHMRATTAIQTIMPPLKQRLREMQYHDALAVKIEDRSSAQKATIAEHQSRTSKISAVMRHLAQQESDIHDLTEDTIDDWKPAPFPT